MRNLEEYYQKVRQYSEKLCEPLNIEDYIPQPVEFASPPKWHLGHTTWFFEELILKRFFNDYKEFNSIFNFLFNSYYNSIGDRVKRVNRGLITRPTVNEVYNYRNYVDDFILNLNFDDISDEIKNLIILGLNHEQQHQELLITDLKYLLFQNPFYPIYSEDFNLLSDVNSEQGFSAIESGLYEVGHNSNKFAYDNEFSRHKIFLDDFEISNSLVTNSDMIEFIESGGYDNFNYWHDDAWHYIQNNNLKMPLYWIKNATKYYQFTLAGLKKINPNQILGHISYYEAYAIANWKGMRLATEFEWEVAADKLKWGSRWEWTNSAYLPYPGFKVASGAVGEYNGKFMVNQMVLRGASNATSEGHSRKTYRNFFHPQMQWQYSGIRLVK